MTLTRRQALSGFAAACSARAVYAGEPKVVTPFQIPFDATQFNDLRRRLAATRWTDAVTRDWSYGTESEFLRDLVAYWGDDYDWAVRCDVLNRLPQFRTAIEGYGLHFLHYRGHSAQAIPLLLMNGWPSSFVEYQKLAPLLAEGEPAFDVVMPALPGFGFSDRPTRPYQVEPADLYPKLMAQLGYDRFIVAGTDIGSGVATRIAMHHPERVIAAHVSAVAEKPRAEDAPPQSAAERAYEVQAAAWDRNEGGYQAIQSSRPQTLAFALADSPAGLASWITEKVRGWTDCGGDVLSVWPRETLVDNLMVYWTTNTIGSSVRYYYEAARLRPPLRPDDFVRAPTAVAVWPHDLAQPPRELAARVYNVKRYTVFPRGGHFPGWEVPVLYADDLRQLARLAMEAT